MTIKIKRLHPDAVIPKYAHTGDSGFDLVAVEDVFIIPGETMLVKTGLAFEIPEGYELQVRPRSGITLKTKLRVQLGTVDSNYRGEVGVIVDNILQVKYESSAIDYNNIIKICKGDRIAQGVIVPVAKMKFKEVDKLGDTERGNKGFGSTGVKNNR